MNAVNGEGRDGSEVGEYGLGKSNERGERLLEFCRTNKLMITNTWFQQEKRRRYPEGTSWRQAAILDCFYTGASPRYNQCEELMELPRCRCEQRP